jgi:hypothetical protein
MSYSFQLFSVGQILTAAQQNQVEANVRDHVHGQSGVSDWHVGVQDAGATDAYAVTVAPAPAAYVTGMTVVFKANTANTGAATLNVNSLGAKTIKKFADQDLGDNNIKAGGWHVVVYDGTNFQLLSALNAGVTVADLSKAQGSVSLATTHFDVQQYAFASPLIDWTSGSGETHVTVGRKPNAIGSPPQTVRKWEITNASGIAGTLTWDYLT